MLPVVDQVPAARASEAATTVKIRTVPRSVRTALLSTAYMICSA